MLFRSLHMCRRRNDHHGREQRGPIDSGDPSESTAPYSYKYSNLDEVVGQVRGAAKRACSVTCVPVREGFTSMETGA